MQTPYLNNATNSGAMPGHALAANQGSVDVDSVTRPQLNELVAQVDSSSIASIKTVVSGLIDLINQPKATAKDLKELIQIDPPLAAKVLLVANSAYYAPRRKIGELTEAIVLIGFDALKEIAIGQKVGSIFNRRGSVGDYSRPMLWRHCVAVALLGKLIYRREFRERGENIYVAGLLHDIGIIAIDQFLPELFEKIMSSGSGRDQHLYVPEDRYLGFNHCDVGRAICENWNLPADLSKAIGCHHFPRTTADSYSRLVMTLHVADHHIQQEGIGFSDGHFNDDKLYRDCLEALDLETHALEMMTVEVGQKITEMEEQGLL